MAGEFLQNHQQEEGGSQLTQGPANPSCCLCIQGSIPCTVLAPAPLDVPPPKPASRTH